MATPDLDLLQGTLDVLVMKALLFGPRHGYAVARWIRDTTDDSLQIEEGALYTALHRLEKRGWVDATWGASENNRKAKFYQLNSAGRRHLDQRTRVWQQYVVAVSKVLSAKAGTA